jgi:hypothetical protein
LGSLATTVHLFSSKKLQQLPRGAAPFSQKVSVALPQWRTVVSG